MVGKAVFTCVEQSQREQAYEMELETGGRAKWCVSEVQLLSQNCYILNKCTSNDYKMHYSMHKLLDIRTITREV